MSSLPGTRSLLDKSSPCPPASMEILTEETLDKPNRRIAELEKYHSNSPYYKGLTDFNVSIKREKQRGAFSYDKKETTPTPTSLQRPTTNPYYRGLTDFSLAIKEQKLSGTSPKKERLSTIPNSFQQPAANPYYRGLTDFSLAINRERFPPPSSSTPGLDVKMPKRGASSCFTFKSKAEESPTMEVSRPLLYK